MDIINDANCDCVIQNDDLKNNDSDPIACDANNNDDDSANSNNNNDDDDENNDVS